MDLTARPPSTGDVTPTTDPAGNFLTLEDHERLHVRRALAAAGGKIHGPTGAAALLEVNPSTLRSRMNKLGISQGRRLT